MNRIIFLNRFFYPDYSATSQILSDLAFGLAKRGKSVHVITSRQLYLNAESQLPETEVVNGVQVTRIATTKFGRSILVGRAADYFSFYVAAYRALRKMLDRDDVVVAMTDPPLVSVVAMLAAARVSARFINYMHDIYPDIAFNFGVPYIRGPLGFLMAYLRDKSLKAADANIVIGSIMGDRVKNYGARPDTLHVLHNWTDDQDVTPLATSDNPLRKSWGLDGKFVVGYSGNLGRTHEFETMLDASERLRGDPRFVFLMIGSGHGLGPLEQGIKKKSLSSYMFMPYQERSLLKHSLCVPDVHWISLKPEMEGLVVPSKFYGIAAAGRPTIVISSPDGEIARLVKQYECGIVVEPGQGEKLARALTDLVNNPSKVTDMGRRARAMIDNHFTREQTISTWSHMLGQVQSTSAAH